MFAGLVVEVESPLGLDSWAAIFGCSFVIVAAMVCSSANTRGVWADRRTNDGRGVWYLSS
jgi:hypothetical protein